MRLLRGVGGAVLWILAVVLGLVGVILCVTILLIPLGLPVLNYARRLFTLSMKLMVPRAVAHPVRSVDRSTRQSRRHARKRVEATLSGAMGRKRRRRRWLSGRRRHRLALF